MTGIIHFPASSRRSRCVSRRTLIAGAACYAATTAFGPPALAQDDAEPDAPVESFPERPLYEGNARRRLQSLLELVPVDALGGPDPNSWLFTWLDLQTHLTVMGSPDLYADATNTAAILAPLVSDDPLFREALNEESRGIFGFSVFDVHQVLVAGVAPDQLTYYAGGLPVADLPSTWEAAGYEKKSGEAGDYWTIGEDGELSLDLPAGRIGTGRLNNAAILNDGIVVFAGTAAQLQQVQALAGGGGESAAGLQDLDALISTMPLDAVNVIPVPGAGLEAQSITPENPGAELNQTTTDLLAESDEAVGPMPEIDMALFGITAGIVAPLAARDDGTPSATPEVLQSVADARFFVHLLAGSAADAVAAAEVVAWRIEHMISPVAGYPYSELLVPEFSTQDAAQGEVAALAFANPRALEAWHQMLAMQDIWPFVWLEAE
ncbi:MAG TPA: hypothetical protein VGR29_04485 [Thermomicrobiales bacterium]|nr:hypothetical protein [Thermomicrobiales bacterium]